jgi:hypothetical protein
VDTKTFLSRVSAPIDEVVVCLWKKDPSGQNPQGIFWNVGSFSDLDDAVKTIQKWDAVPEYTVYFSVARMANNQFLKPDGKTGYRRTKDHATWFKAICFDMDIGGKYATQKEGHTALVAALKVIGMPAPMVVNSGRGIHYYWPLVSAIPRAEWETTSIALRLALAEQNVEIDTSKIHDASMVLRPAGASHKKQVPWRTVTVMADCPDYEHDALRAALASWVGKAQVAPVASKKMSSTAAAILRNCNVDVVTLGTKCKQIGAMLASGGEFDASGAMVTEPMWRGALGIAAFATDQEAAMMMLSQDHPDFDHAASMQKMNSWTAGPTTCAYFEQHCPSGCGGCPYKGVVSPVSINEEPPAVPTTPTAIQAPRVMPAGYYVQGGRIYTDIEKEESTTGEDGKKNKAIRKIKTLVCPYEVHVIAMYHDVWGTKATANSTATATISVRYPMDGEQEHELPMEALFAGGKEFSAYLAGRQIILPSATTAELTRVYIMRYLERIQQDTPSGIDFKRFGWQDDGSFLCGEHLLGSPTTNTLRRLKGSAKVYGELIRKHGDRETWCELTRLLDEPDAETFGVGLLTACMGALGNTANLATPIIAFYSSFTGTGKTLTLSLGSSAFMDPGVQYMFQPSDTDNAIYQGLGTLGDLSGAMDEVTIMNNAQRAIDMAYIVTGGREKKTVTRGRIARDPEVWGAPLRISTNSSMYEMFDTGMSQNEPVRVRTLQFELHSRAFVNKHGEHMAHVLHDNFGHAMPELVEAVIAMGGRKVVWDKGLAAFERRYAGQFSPEERFLRAACISCFTVGHIGKQLGLFRFDVDRIVQFMVDRVAELRTSTAQKKLDAFDTIGQFMQEFNHQLIVTRGEVGGKPQPMYPMPDQACMRMEIVYDQKTAVLPTSRLAINSSALKTWLRKSKDSADRLIAELVSMGAVLGKHERVTMYKGCPNMNPGQSYCLVIDLTHPRMATVLSGGKPVPVTSPLHAVLQATP